MPMRESARGHASSRRLPRSQTSRFSLFPPDPSPRLCQYCRPHPFFLHPEAIQDRLFSVFRFCGRRSFLANAKASLSCPDRTVCFARISRSINLLRRDQFSESCRLRPCFFTILSEARSRHCRFSIIFSPSLSAIFCDAQIALVITHFCRKGTIEDHRAWGILCHASVRRIIIEGACLELAQGPSGNTCASISMRRSRRSLSG